MEKIFNVISNKPFKIFYNGLVPRNLRKRWKYLYSDRIQQETVASYWNKVINEYENDKITKHHIRAIKKELVGKKVIWQYWGQGLNSLPNTVKLCFASVDYYSNEHQVVRITDENIHEYLEIPEFIYEKRKNSSFKPVFFSDILRVALLSSYGGVWLDASILLTEKLPSQYQAYNFFMYTRDPQSPNQSWGKGDIHFYFNWRDDFKVNHLSSIMFAKPNSQLARVLLDLLLFYWETQEQINYYFFFQVLINELRLSNLIDFGFPIADDTFPHLLQTNMNKIYDEKELARITSAVSIHKLTIHEDLNESNLSGKKTYYGFLKDKYFNL